MKTEVIPNLNRVYPNAKIVGVAEFYIPESVKIFAQHLRHGWNKENKKTDCFVWDLEYYRTIGAFKLCLLIELNTGFVIPSDWSVNELQYL